MRKQQLQLHPGNFYQIKIGDQFLGEWKSAENRGIKIPNASVALKMNLTETRELAAKLRALGVRDVHITSGFGCDPVPDE